ncbi:MAG: serine/threonine-protein kinase [Planctomycetota bacterium]
MKLRLPFQRERDQQLWGHCCAVQPTLVVHAARARRALELGLSPLGVLERELEPETYLRALARWRAAPPPALEWAGYRIGVEAGRGAHGVVYWATRAERALALKVLGPEADLRRFSREVEVLRALALPGVVPLLDAGVAEGSAYLVTPALRGGDLARRSPLPPPDALRLIQGLAGTLAAAHRAGVVHRDLKPQNVLFDDEGRAHVIDFGLAKLTDGEPLTQTSAALGSLGYLAPEQLGAANRVGPAADAFALGALLHAALTGRPPYPTTSVGAYLLAARAGFTGLPPGPWGPSRPTLDALLKLALAPRPPERLDAQALSEALSGLVPGV